ncbi:unnamed protein product [Pedinophyceae sp. YPF-701]|nr:unnamed protein product [Pedinophyceae sp. YPF-701]
MKTPTATFLTQLEAQLKEDLSHYADGSMNLHNVRPGALMRWIASSEMPKIAERARTHVPGTNVKVVAMATLSRLVYGLRSIFDHIGRRGEYSWRDKTGNPARSDEVLSFMRGYRNWLDEHDVSARPAVPMGRVKITNVLSRLYGIILPEAAWGKPAWFLAISEFCAYALLYMTWLRGSELVALSWGDVTFEALPGYERWLGLGELRVRVRHSKHAALVANVVPQRVAVDTVDYPYFQFGLRYWVDACARATYFGTFNIVVALVLYRSELRKLGVNADDDTLIFRATERGTGLPGNDGLSAGALLERLKSRERGCGVYGGETLHSFRRGGLQDSLARHVLDMPAAQARGRWESVQTMLHYLVAGHMNIGE